MPLGMSFLQAMRRDYLGTLAKVHAQCPDAARMQVLWRRSVHVFHPDLVRELLVEQADKLKRWERVTTIFAQGMGQEGVLVTEGAQWQRQRRLLQAGFGPKRVSAYTRHMVDACDSALRALDTPQHNTPHDMHALMTQVTMDVIVRALFGHARQIDSARVSHAIHALSTEGYAQVFRPWLLPAWFPWPSVQRARRAKVWLDQLIAGQIAHKRAEAATTPAHATDNEAGDLLTMLLQARDPEQPEQGLSPQEVHDQTMVMFQAGHETSATALTWWAGLVARHPEVAQRLHNEVDSVLQGAMPDADCTQRMPWLMASLKESLRLYPAAAILMTRCSAHDLHCGPWRLSAGDLITITPALIQRDARWFPEPELFKPERFLPGAPDIPRGAWMPFGSGPRVCLGQHFAMMEMAIIAAMLVQRFSLEWPQGQTWPEGEVSITLRPATPMLVRLTPR
jgi:cytochrome P450